MHGILKGYQQGTVILNSAFSLIIVGQYAEIVLLTTPIRIYYNTLMQACWKRR
jgi:hypothetical protein